MSVELTSVAARPTGFVGLSHLGIVCGIGWASLGGHVIAVDPRREVIEELAGGDLPIHEPGLGPLWEGVRASLRLTTDFAALRECPLVILAQDVPTAEDNRSDLDVVHRLIDRVLPHLPRQGTLVIMSQVPAGFTRAVAGRARTEYPERDLGVYYWVETLVLGRAVERYLHPERIILGCEDPAKPWPEALAQGLRRFDCPVLPMRYESAELTKTAINLYLASAVTFANTLSDLCERIGADWSEVTPALRLDARIGRAAYIRPGLGIAGGNLERDLVTLTEMAAAHGSDSSFIQAITAYNERRTRWVLDKLDTLLFPETPRPTIALWGLAYKKGTQSVKNSPALRVISDLAGRALLRAYDPVVGQLQVDGVTVVSHRDEAAAGADCLLIMTDWDEFGTANVAELGRNLRRSLVIDPVGALEHRRAELEGLRYVSMGRPVAG
jgi:UDPglucose 6-dehydrogenase